MPKPALAAAFLILTSVKVFQPNRSKVVPPRSPTLTAEVAKCERESAANKKGSFLSANIHSHDVYPQFEAELARKLAKG